MAIVRRMLRSYMFRDKDPIKDELQTMLQDIGMFGDLDTVAVLANVSKQTVQNLFFGETRRPQNATVEGIVRSMGYERVLRQVKQLDVEKELEVARAFNKSEDKRVARANAKVGMGKKRRTRKTKKKVGLRLVHSAA
jgi:hypothetical protein